MFENVWYKFWICEVYFNNCMFILLYNCWMLKKVDLNNIVLNWINFICKIIKEVVVLCLRNIIDFWVYYSSDWFFIELVFFSIIKGCNLVRLIVINFFLVLI